MSDSNGRSTAGLGLGLVVWSYGRMVVWSYGRMVVWSLLSPTLAAEKTFRDCGELFKGILEPQPLRRPTNGAAFVVIVNGKKKVLRLAQRKDFNDFEKIANRLSEAGFGVPYHGRIDENPKTVIEKLGIPDPWGVLKKNTSAIDAFDYIDGIEIKKDWILKNDAEISLGTLKKEGIVKQLEQFLEYCNGEGIEIGFDFQYFVTADSKIIVFDYDHYSLKEPGKALQATNESVMRSVIDSWASGKLYLGRLQ